MEVHMKTLSLKMGKKVFTSGKITAWHSREAFAINKDLIDFANRGKELKSKEEKTTQELADYLDGLAEINTRKANLICEVYGNKFTLDELEKSLSTDEITEQLTMIVQGITGIVQKN